MPEPKAGYRFVPLNSQVCPAPLGFARKQPDQPLPQDKISLGRPLPNGFSGTIKVTWEAETPICVGQREKASQADGDEKPGATRPCKLGDDYAIPGSSLKGMLRSVVEILSFSHLGQINARHHFGYRDFNDHDYYREKVKSNDMRSGWLSFDGQRWILRQCAGGEKGFKPLPIKTLLSIVCKPNGLAGLGALEMQALINNIKGARANRFDDLLRKIRKIKERNEENQRQGKRPQENRIDLATYRLDEGLRAKVLNEFLEFEAERLATELGGSLTLDYTDFSVPECEEIIGWLQGRISSTKLEQLFWGKLSLNWKALSLATKRQFLQRCPALGGEYCEFGENGEMGYIVCSDKTLLNGNKRTETIFYPPTGEAVTLTQESMKRFARLHSKFGRNHWVPDGSWAYWLNEMNYPDPLDTSAQLTTGLRQPNSLPGIPVFYCGRLADIDDVDKFCMGFSRVIKIPYRHSVGQVAARTLGAKNNEDYSIPRLAGQDLDFARAIFGDVEETHEGRKNDKDASRDALKGRVAFGFAWATQAQESEVRDTILMGPRASFWPFYLHDAKDHSRAVTYNSPFAELAGRKRYPARSQAGGMPVPGIDQASVTSQVSFLEAGAKFDGEIRFHNLHPVELGALLCALALGEKDGHTRHSLGHAKAFGYGRLNCQYELLARPNYGRVESPSSADFIRQFCAYMEDWYRSNHLGGDWARSPQVLALLRTSYPVKSADLHQRLGSFAEPKQFADFKKGPRPSALPGYVREFETMEKETPVLGEYLQA